MQLPFTNDSVMFGHGASSFQGPIQKGAALGQAYFNPGCFCQIWAR